MKHSFRSIKDATVLDSILPPKAAPSRVSLVSAGNPDVLREAAGLADYANPRKRRRGGRVKVDGHKPRPRLDRPSRGRKFADGGSADEQSDQSAQTTASSDDASTGRGFVDELMAIPKIRGITTGLAAMRKATPVVMRAALEPSGPKPAYRAGGRADAPRVGSDVLRANSKVRAVGAAARQGARR
jgi:hypothetical protein